LTETCSDHRLVIEPPLGYTECMQIYLARHGRTNYNDLDLCNADPSIDVHLTNTGIEQAKKLSRSLKGSNIERIYVSELRRTSQTATYVNKYHNVEIQVDKRLNDNKTGYDSKPATEYYSALESAPDKWTVRFNDGESWEDTKTRVQAFLDDLKTQPYSSVLIITSMVVIQIIHSLISHLSNERALNFKVVQGGYTEIDI
jgi:broad specificity phosphatase PhoE